MTAGSDNHNSPVPAPYGVELEKRLTTIDDYVKIILDKGRIELHVPADRFDVPADAEPDARHCAFMLNDQEFDILSPKQWMRDG